MIVAASKTTFFVFNKYFIDSKRKNKVIDPVIWLQVS